MSSIEIYRPDIDHTLVLRSLLVETNNRYDFPHSLLCYGESLSTSVLICIDDDIWFRQRGKFLILITYQCSAAKLAKVVKELWELGYELKSLPLENGEVPGLPCRYSCRSWYVTQDWSIDKVLADHSTKARKHLNAAIHNGYGGYYAEYIDKGGNHEDVWDLFDEWVHWRKTTPGYGMVVLGYAHRWLERYLKYQPDNVYLLGWRSRGNDRLVGMFGYEVHNGKAQVAISKNVPDPGMADFSKFMWLSGLNHILFEHASLVVYCGTYTDQLKAYLRLEKTRSYKIKR